MNMEKGINGKLTVLITALIVAAVTFFVFLPSLQNEFLNWDDNKLITDNYHIRSLDLNTVKWAFTNVGLTTWHPLVFISFAVDHAIWGLDSWGFHLTNNILHSLNALLVFMLVYWLVNIAGRGNEEEGRNELALVTGVVTALLFGLHPMRVESVAWVTERKDVLYAFFYLLGILAYLGYASSERRRIRFYVVSVIFFVMSLMSKPMAVTLPAVLLILDYYPLRRIYSGMGMDRIRVVAFEKIPFFLLSVLMSVVTVLLDNPE